jgi:hypothetical protein
MGFAVVIYVIVDDIATVFLNGYKLGGSFQSYTGAYTTIPGTFNPGCR